MPFTLLSLSFEPRCVTLGEPTRVRALFRNDCASRCTAFMLRLDGAVRSVGVSPLTGLDVGDLNGLDVFGSGATAAIDWPAGEERAFEAVYTPAQGALPDENLRIDLSGRTAVDSDAGGTGLFLSYASNCETDTQMLHRSWAELLGGTFAILAEHYSPRLLTATLERVDRTTEEPGEEGEAARLAATWTSLSPAPLPLVLRYRRAGADADEGEIDLTDQSAAGSFDGVLVPEEAGRFANGINWELRLVYGDACEEDSLSLTLPRAFANVHLSAFEDGGVCFGGFSTSSADHAAKFECHYPAYFYGGIALGGRDYASEPVRAGSWIDGRAVYRRVFAPEDIALARGTKTTPIAELGAGVLPLSLGGGMVLGGAWVPFPSRFYTTGTGSYSLSVADGVVTLRTTLDAATTAQDICLIAEYVET